MTWTWTDNRNLHSALNENRSFVASKRSTENAASHLNRSIVAIAIALFISGCGITPPRIVPDVPTTESLPVSNNESNSVTLATDNLLQNVGFEEHQVEATESGGDEIVYWSTSGDVELDEEEVSSGRYSVRVQADDSTSRISSALFAVTPHSRIEFSGKMKAQDVVSPGSYHRLRITLSAFAADGETKIRHVDLVSTSGSFDWQVIQSAIIVPSTAHFMRLDLSLTKCTGVFWADELSVREIQSPPQQLVDGPQTDILPSETGLPKLVPVPWQMMLENGQRSINNIAIFLPSSGVADQPRFSKALQTYLTAAPIQYQFLPSDFTEEAAVDYVLAHSSIDTLLLVGDETSNEITSALNNSYPNLVWSDMGDEGYFLSIRQLAKEGRLDADSDVDEEQKNIALLGANSEAGHFYGLQSLKQLIDERGTAPNITIADRPTLSRRGTPVGIQWYRESARLMERLSTFKFNFVWNQGTFENQIFWYRWREPMSDSTKESIRAYLDLAHLNFITPFISIGPRGEDASSPTIYSSEEDIAAVVRKMEQLYDLGVRHFGLSFDDLNNVEQDILFGKDIDEFENIGEAHTYFTNQVFRRLYTEHDDIEMMIVPMVYNGLGHLSDVEQAYLTAISKLPKEIGLYSSTVYQRDAEAALIFTERPHFVWDNYWASFYSSSNPAPQVAVPLDRSLLEDTIVGYSFMPIVPSAEDSFLLSWQSAANFAWSPSRYITPGAAP